jgi:methionyl aminopeptidase
MYLVGEASIAARRLCAVTFEAMWRGIVKVRPGARLGDIGHAIQTHAEHAGFSVVREFCGHGVGRKLHEPPEVPNYGRRGQGAKLHSGMVLAIEPMINMGTRNIKQLKDGWTILTADGKPSAHFEHDVALIDGKPELLSTFQYIYDALGIVSNEEDEFRRK